MDTSNTHEAKIDSQFLRYYWLELSLYVKILLECFIKLSIPSKFGPLYAKEVLKWYSEPGGLAWKNDENAKKPLEDIIHMREMDMPLIIHSEYDEFRASYLENRCQPDEDVEANERYW